jgi:hypothetical protein
MSTSLVTFTLTSADAKHHIPFAIQVPAGTTQLTIRLTFSPAMVDDIKNMLTLSVFDPTGWRGARHRHGTEHVVIISAQHATHGYLAGPIQAGEWTIVIDTHMIMPGEPCEIRLDISATDEPTNQPTNQPINQPTNQRHSLSRGRGWYRGDLHAHTIHSDASWDVPDLLAWARECQLDFVTLSDHNTIAGLAQMDEASSNDPSTSSRQVLLTMGGMELTTFWGHALALGLREWIDWRVSVVTPSGVMPHTTATEVATTGHTMEQIAAEVTARGGTFIIAHPMAIGDPYCTGCQWIYRTMMPGTARVVEVWNSDWGGNSRNEDGLGLVYAWLNQGHRLALTAGTDNHGRMSQAKHYGFNVVYADDLSEVEILRAVRKGHSYLSAGPQLKLSAFYRGEQALMGDVLRVTTDDAMQVTALWDDCLPGMQINLIADGRVRSVLDATQPDERTWEFKGGQARWCLLTLRDLDGRMWALTNPIYFAEDE